MSRTKNEQKFVSFSEKGVEFEGAQSDIRGGWSVVSLMSYNGRYVGIMEKSTNPTSNPDGSQMIYIPPRKKIKIR
jgi:hypothetical protein